MFRLRQGIHMDAREKKGVIYHGESIGLCMLSYGRRKSKDAEVLPENL